MTVSILLILVIAESFIILLAAAIYLARKNFKLKKAIDSLLTTISEIIFPKLIHEEISHTNNKITELSEEDFNLAEDDDEKADDEFSADGENAETIQSLKFRLSYLQAELDAYDSSEGDPELFWIYLAENITSLLPQAKANDTDTKQAEHTNEFINEILQDLQTKFNKANDSNLMLQALLDNIMKDNNLNPEQINTIKQSQNDYHALSQNISDLEQQIQNSLNLTITTNISSGENNPLDISHGSNKVNVEANKLKETIAAQANQIDALLKSVKASGNELSSEIVHQIEVLERSQKETTMCMEVLEMENNRLMSEVQELQSAATSSQQALTDKVNELELTLAEKGTELKKTQAELSTLETEYQAAYDKNNKT